MMNKSKTMDDKSSYEDETTKNENDCSSNENDNHGKKLDKLVYEELDKYTDNMNDMKSSADHISEERLKEFHKICLDNTMKSFEKSLPKLTLFEMKYKKKLKEMIKYKFEKTIKEHLLECEDEIFRAKYIISELENYHNEEMKLSSDKIFSINNLKSKHESLMQESVEKLRKKFIHIDQNKMNDMISKLKKELESQFVSVSVIFEMKKDSILKKLVAEEVINYKAKIRKIANSVTIEMLKSNHEVYFNEAIQNFNQSLYVDSEIGNDYIVSIEDQINEDFGNILSIQRNRELFLQKSIAELLTEFKSLIDEKISREDYLNEADLREYLIQEKDKSIMKFIVDFKISESEEKFPDSLDEKMQKILDLSLISNVKKNDSYQNKSPQMLIFDFKTGYIEKINSFLSDYGDEEGLIAKHDKFKNEYLNELKLELVRSHCKSIEKFSEILSNELESIFSGVLKFYRVSNDNIKLRFENLVESAKNFYTAKMDKKFENDNFFDENELFRMHQSSKVLALNMLIQKTPDQKAPRKIIDEFMKSIDIIFKSFQRKNILNSPNVETIGIDLGTTYCCVGAVVNGKVKLIPLENQKTTMPSYVSFLQSGEEVFGSAAKDTAFESPANTIYGVKRLIGRKFSDDLTKIDTKFWQFHIISDKEKPKIQLRNSKKTTLHPEEISAKLLRKLKEKAESELNCKIKKAVITVPAYFNDAQRQATKDAGKIAGLAILKILNEPTSAAVAYFYQVKDVSKKNILVYDLGGGTFDVAVVVLDEGKIDVKAVGGDTHLGGQDFDQRVIELCRKEFEKNHKKNLDERALQRLKNQCEVKKWELSSNKETTIVIDALMHGLDFRMTITRSRFEEMNMDLFKKTMEHVSKVLIEANMKATEIDEIILIGGSTRIPKIQEMLSKFFRAKPLNKSINPDEAVAYGAAIQAAILDGDASLDVEKYRIQDVAPYPIGVEVINKTNSIVIPKNTKLPCENTRSYRTVKDKQTKIEIKIYEGDHTKVAKNRLLGEFEIDDIPPNKAGQEVIDVTMTIDDEGILHITAKSQSTFNIKKFSIRDTRLRIPEYELNMIIAKERNS